MGILSAYLLVYIVLRIGLMATGLDQVNGVVTVAATLKQPWVRLGDVSAS